MATEMTTMTTRMRRPSVRAEGRRLLALTTIGLVLVLLLVACGRAEGADIPTASENQGTAPADTNPAPAPVDEFDAALAYARCIRDNGFPEWPAPNAEGQFMMRRDQGMSFNDPRRIAAMEACQDLRPAGIGGGTAGLGGPGAGGFADQEQALAFARCMRENGVADFPDPVAGGGRIVIQGGGPGQGALDPNDPTFQAAVQTCRASVLEGAQ
jgi:hypothetical protein